MNNFIEDIKNQYNILNIKITELIQDNPYLYDLCFTMTYDEKVNLLKLSRENNRNILEDYAISERELKIYLIYHEFIGAQILR